MANGFAGPMQILLVTGRFPERSETFIYRKCVGLAKRGHRVTVMARTNGDASLLPQSLPENVRLEILPPSDSLTTPGRSLAALVGGLRYASRAPISTRSLYKMAAATTPGREGTVRRLLRHLPFVSRTFDIVHFEFLGIGSMYPLAGELVSAPLFMSCRGQDVHMLELRPERERAALLDSLRNADALHCVSSELARAVERLTGRTHNVFINRPAVDVERIVPATRAATTTTIRIVASGRLTWVKGFDYLLTALAQLRSRGVDFCAEIIGDGELKSVLRFSIEDLGLEDHVTLVGGVSADEAQQRLANADVFVLSSIEEGISNAVLEAMAAGLPIVTTSAGGMVEAVTDGIEGFVVPVRDSKLLAERLQQLALDPALRKRMGRAERARAVAEFSLDRQIGLFEEMYSSVRRERT